MESAVSEINKKIDKEKWVNFFTIKGVILEKPISNLKRYQVARILNFRQTESKNHSRYNQKNLIRNLQGMDTDKTIPRASNNMSSGNLPPPAPTLDNKLSTEQEFAKNGTANSNKNIFLEVVENENDANNISSNNSQNLKAPPVPFDNPSYQAPSIDLNRGLDTELLHHKSKYSMKNIVQSIFKQLKNVFTKDDLNMPNETLFRAIIIKKLLLYLVLVLTLLSMSYLGYISVYGQYIRFKFKMTSASSIISYHNATLGLINEYYLQERLKVTMAGPKPPIKPSDYPQEQIFSQQRVSYLQNMTMEFDSNDNIRNDFFFTNLGTKNVSFGIRYASKPSFVREYTSSQYTIFTMLIEKLLAISDSRDKIQDMFIFIDDNYLSIVNRYCIDSFKRVTDDMYDQLDLVKAVFVNLESNHRLPVHLHNSVLVVYGSDLRHISGNQTLHLRCAVRLQFHRSGLHEEDLFFLQIADKRSEHDEENPEGKQQVVFEELR